MSEGASIDIDTGKACTRCGALGATPRGVCLECIAEELKDGLGEKGAQTFMAAVTGQMSLTTEWVELDTEERIARGKSLADALLALARMKHDHGLSKKVMKEDETALEVEIARLCDIVRSGQEERPVGMAH